MKIIQKIVEKARDNRDGHAVSIAFLGDSVTQGCFELYRKGPEGYAAIFDKEYAYCNYVRKILDMLYPSVPVHIINAGVSGDNAVHGFSRLRKDVLPYKPDLTVVCFGLNDSNRGIEGLTQYVEALKNIFDELEHAGSEIIFMTPNMMATTVSCFLEDPELRKIAENACRIQNEGIMDTYMHSAKELCQRRNIPVCDCYEKWKTLAENGVETTELLSNKINHPTREMNMLFGLVLVEAMMR